MLRCVSSKSSQPTSGGVRQARLARRRTIRRRVIGGAVALFLATWLLITVTLVRGHDPALAARAATSTTAAPSSTSTNTTSTPSAPSTTGSSNSGTAGALTTRSS